MNLFELSSEYKEALESLSNMDLPPEAVEDTLQGLEGEIKDKIRNCAAYTKNLEALAEAKKAAAKQLNEDANKLQSRCQNMKEYIDRCMKLAKIDKVEYDLFAVKYRKLPASVVIEDESQVPHDFLQIDIVKKPDKKYIKSVIESGSQVLGCSLSANQYKLVIK